MQDIANQILASLKTNLGTTWDRLSGDDQSLVQQVAFDAASLQVDALATDPKDTAAIAALAREQQQIDAQLLNLSAGAAGEVRNAFWQTVKSAGGVLLKIGLAAV